MELSHPDPVTLNRIADEFVAELGNIDGVFDIRSSRDDGFRELQLELKPAARSLGLTRDDLARQVRSAFFGAEALRVLRGREDRRVYVRLPEEERNSVADIDNYVVRTSGGAEIPLGHIASAHFTRWRQGTCSGGIADFRHHVSRCGPPCLRARPGGSAPRPGSGGAGLWRARRHSASHVGRPRPGDVAIQSPGTDALKQA